MNMNTILATLAVLALLFATFVNVMVVLSVRKLSNARRLLTLVHRPERIRDAPEITDWAEQQGFELVQQFDFAGLVGTDKAIEADAWLSQDRRQLLMHYHFQGRHWLEFVSSLEGRYGLVTSVARESLTLPQPPNQLVQVFPGRSPEELHRLHIQALEAFRQRFGADTVEPDRPVNELVIEAIEEQVAWVRQLPLWQLRGVWWYLVRPRLLRNRSVVELLDKL